MGAVQGQGALDHRGLVRHAAGVQPGSRPDQRAHRRIQQRAGHGRRRGGIADAHLAADEQLAAGLLGAAHAFAPGLERQQALFGAHRRGLDEVRGTRRQAQVAHAGQGFQGDGGAQVDHLQAGAEFARQHADRRAAADEVAQHLAGDRLRIGRDALGDYPVVAGEDRHPEPLQARSFAPLQRRQVDRHLLQAAQRAARLGQPVLAFGRAPAHLRVRLAAGVAPPLQTHSGSPFNGMGRPATVKVTRSQRSARAWCSQPASST